jgi:endonuclease/exonuclease/phosphatase family metal-dependent hydrolase
MRMTLWGLVALTALACEPLVTSWEERTEFAIDEAADLDEAAPASELKVMTWNVKYGGGRINFWFDYWGERVHMTEAEVASNMAGIYKLINEVQPDVILTQEIDRNSKRTAYFDMVQGILDHTSLNYAAYTPVWRARYVATQGLGRVDSGIAVLSKYPIVSNTRIGLVDRTDQDALTKAFYLHRAVNRAVIKVGDREVVLLNLHVAAYDTDGTRKAQLAEVMSVVGEETLPALVGGDFNAIPPGSAKVHGFDDESRVPEDSQFDGGAYDLTLMEPFYAALTPSMTLDAYGVTEDEQKRWYTHTVAPPVDDVGETHFWGRTLDYHFATQGDFSRPAEVLQAPGDGADYTGSPLGIVSDPMLLSDHAPVVATWRLP